MKDSDLQRLNDGIRDVQDFPKPGIVFKDITPVLSDGELFRLSIDGFIETAREAEISKIIGIDARGFIFGAAVADRLGVGFVPIRKKGKLPWVCEGIAYKLEYGDAEVEVHRDAIVPGEKVMMVDDLLATGGTAGAALELVKKLGGDVVCATFLIELEFLNGRDNLPDDIRVESLLKY
ncbi:MAG: adenine phosphoribosyltransferase [Verrucomicrobiales bacterium]|nr:adenine phosphoribosyltransferase [Verrucomicrobiales bacterium]